VTHGCSSGFAIAAALTMVFAAGFATLHDPVGAYPVLMLLVAVGGAGWLLGASRADRANPGALRFVLALALIARLLAVLPAVPLSDDLYRYLWDGRVANAGIDPFAYPPSAPELAALRDDRVWPNVNHPEVPTIYPPVAQLAFRVMDAVAPGPRTPRAHSRSWRREVAAMWMRSACSCSSRRSRWAA